MAFTTSNDINILQASDSTNISAGAGDDKYIISGDLISDNQTISISDTEGANTIQLVGGLSITSSSVAADAAQLTLSNGAVITLLGASSFSYLVGGDSLTGAGGTTEDYSTFATNTLGVSAVPAEGEDPAAGTAVEIDGGTSGGGEGETFVLSTTATSKVVTGTAGSDTIDGSTEANSASGYTIADASTTDADVMNMKITSNLTATPVISNVETINADFAGFNLTFDASNVSNGKLVVSSSQQFNSTANISGLASNNVNVGVDSTITTLDLETATSGSGAVEVDLAGGSLTISTGTNTLKTLTLDSQNSANTVTNSHNAAAWVVQGDQDLTLVGDLDTLLDGETVTNNMTAGTFTLKNNTTLGTSLDLSKTSADAFDFAANSGTQTITFASGTTAVALNNAAATDGTFTASGSETTDVLNLTANKTMTGTLATTGFETVTIADTTSVAQSLTSANFGSAKVSISGANNVTLGTAVTAAGLDLSGLTGTATATIQGFALTGTSGTVTGTANNDSITIADNAGDTITVNAGEGDNTVAAAASGNTTILVMNSGSGNDSLTGAAGNDTFISGAGNDIIDGAAGNDSIFSGAGNDTITIGAGNDAVVADSGDDLITGADNVTTADVIAGGAGTDTLTLGDDTATTDLDNVTGVEIITITNTDATSYTTVDTLVDSGSSLTVTQTGDFVLTFNGSAETDGTFSVTAGGNAAHVLTGGAGNDTLTVTSATSVATVSGGAGNDTITVGGAAAHVITGGAGADVVDFGSAVAGELHLASLTDSTTTSYDKVSNVTINSEVIDLSATGLGLAFSVAGDVTGSATVGTIATGLYTAGSSEAFTSVADAVTKVGADVKTAGQAVLFEYGGNTYFFADTDGASTTTNDILIELTGLDSTTMTAAAEVFTIAS